MKKILEGTMFQRTKSAYTQLVRPFNNKAMFEEFPNELDGNFPMNWRAEMGIEPKYPSMHSSVGLLKGITRLAWILYADHVNQPIKGFGGYAKLKDGSILAEYWDDTASTFMGMEDYSSSPRIVVRITPDHEVSGVVIDEAGKRSTYVVDTSYQRNSSSHSPCAIAFAQMCDAMTREYEADGSDSFFGSFCHTMYAVAFSLKDGMLEDHVPKDVCYLYNFAFSMIRDTDDVCRTYHLDSSPFFPELPSETIPMLDLDNISEEVDRSSVVGCLSFLKKEEAEKKVPEAEQVTGAMCFGLYSIDKNRVLTDMEKNFIPEIDPEWVIPAEVTNMAKAIQVTSSMKSPIRNLILSGPAGTGKTESTKMLAAELGIPYVNFSCAPDTERMDLTLSVIPNAKVDDDSDKVTKINVTDPADWGFDPEGCYKQLTGEDKDGASAMDCLNAVLATANNTAGEGFRYVYSNIVKAFKYGWLCEIQEPTIIAKSGVLPSINSMLDKCRSITLMNGETVTRHPDCVICFTTNLDYEGCNPINQSVLSRCIPVNLHPLTEDEAVSRVISASGYNDRKIIKKMVNVYFACQEYARSGYVTDGAIDMRGLIDWATMNMVNGEYYENGMICLINKCTLDHDLQIEFEGCLKKHFSVGEASGTK